MTKIAGMFGSDGELADSTEALGMVEGRWAEEFCFRL